MIRTLKDALRIKEIRSKIIFTFLMILVIRLGSQLPTPGVNVELFKQWFTQNLAATGGAADFLTALTGGAFTDMTVFALGINPYITSSIIIQLLTIAIPKLEEMQKEGEDGRKKIRKYTRYATVILALIESIAMAIAFSRSNYLIDNNILGMVTVVVSLTGGAMLLMWIGERITERGIGNGISVVLAINIMSRLPQDLKQLYDKFIAGSSNIITAGLAAIAIIVVIVAMVLFVVYLQGGERRIPVQYSKKVVGRKQMGGQSSNIPLKVNMAGVMPIIFTSSIMSLPGMIVNLTGARISGIPAEILKYLTTSNWFVRSDMKYTVGLIVYMLLVVFFAYFYTSISFNPIEVADNMKKQGGFIPGIRPGKPTVEIMTRILGNMIIIGAIGLIIIQLVPFLASGILGVSVSFAGTSIIIIVGVILETLKQVESMMLVRHHKGFLNS